MLSSATDWNVVLWDVVSREAELCLRFLSPVTKVQFNPRDKGAFLVCPMRHTPTLMRLEGEGMVHVPLSTDGEPETSMTGSDMGRVLGYLYLSMLKHTIAKYL